MTTITINRATVEQALEALEDAKALLNNKDRTTTMWFADEITALRAALAQQAEPVEPVARLNKKISFDEAMRLKDQMPKGLFRRVDGQAADEIWLCAIEVAELHHNITDPQIEDRLARHGIPMPGDPK